MKKIVLVAFALLGVAAISVAQSLQISYHDNVQSNGAVINVQGDANQAIKVGLHVKNISATQIEVKAKKNHITILPNTENNFCFANYCYPPFVFVSSSSSVLTPSQKDTTFEADYNAGGVTGVTTVQYVFFNVGNPNDSSWVNVNFQGTVGIEDISAVVKIDAFPNPASNNVSFVYSVPSQVESQKIIIRNMLGAIVKTIDLGDKSTGKKQINIEDLKDGIYFYSVLANNKICQTRKLIIKR